MKRIFSYCNLLRLSKANEYILKIYYSLYYNVEGNDRKSFLSEKISTREKIKLELQESLNKLDKNSASYFSRLSILIFAGMCSQYHFIKDRFQTINWQTCHEQELHNINLYYSILYSRQYPKFMTDLLISQKSAIEDMVMVEI